MPTHQQDINSESNGRLRALTDVDEKTGVSSYGKFWRLKSGERRLHSSDRRRR